MGMNEESYVPAHLAIIAMRDNGYKNTAYAVAELMDNSIQAEASCVQLLCAEKEEELATRKTKRLNQIALLDNGKGMDSKVLKMALQFGNGTRLDKAQRKGIGRFGMGLPASSISQCKRVDVWTWQNGIENSLHTYLDIDDIKNSDTIPEPSSKPLPEIWRRTGIEFGPTGTLVVWSKLDRLMWSKASTLIENSESLIGAMYRKFLDEGKVKIRLAAFLIDDLKTFTIDKFTLPNDPGYLMEKTTCPAPFNDKPMFNPFGDEFYERKYLINFHGEVHEVSVRFSIAKDEARANDNAGSTPYGKHAAKNIGVSIVRAGRELDLDQSLVIKYDARERWWGIEVEFPPALDELMGVTNNKQSARNFAEVMDLDIESLSNAGKTLDQIITEMQEEGDPRAPLIEMTNDIKNQVITMRKLIKEQRRGSGSTGAKRHKNIHPEKTATELTNQRKQDGYKGTSDIDDEKPTEEKEQEITAELVESGIDQQTAEQLAANTVSNNLKYLFAETPLEGDAFFTVRPRGGAINVLLNTRHPAYEHLVEVLNEETINDDVKALRERLEKASEGLKLLLMAWARYEDELSAQRKDQAQDARNDWGRVAKSFLKEY